MDFNHYFKEHIINFGYALRGRFFYFSKGSNIFSFQIEDDFIRNKYNYTFKFSHIAVKKGAPKK